MHFLAAFAFVFVFFFFILAEKFYFSINFQSHVDPVYCLGTYKFYFSATFSLKMGLTVLFTYLKIILLQYFSVFNFQLYPNGLISVCDLGFKSVVIVCIKVFLTSTEIMMWRGLIDWCKTLFYASSRPIYSQGNNINQES